MGDRRRPVDPGSVNEQGYLLEQRSHRADCLYLVTAFVKIEPSYWLISGRLAGIPARRGYRSGVAARFSTTTRKRSSSTPGR
jgi:hypothetical protein